MDRLMKQLKILLVEDCKIAQKMGTYILEEMGCHVSSAYNGAQALDLSLRHHYDLIFMDIGLGDLSGCHVTKSIRASGLNQTTPIIALTAHQDQEMKEHCLGCGMNAYMVKPLTEELFQEILQTLNLDLATELG